MKSKIEHRLLAFSFFLVLAGSLNAATRNWDGGGGDGFFSTRANWDGDNVTTPVPVSNTDTLQVGANTSGNPNIGFDTQADFRTPSFTFLGTANLAYTVQAVTGGDALTLTGQGVALQNLSAFRQTFFGISMTVGPVGAAAQTWDGGTSGLVLAQIALDSNVLTIAGEGTTASNRNVISGKIVGTVSSGVTKTGGGTLLFDSSIAADYLGATTLESGQLQLGRADQIPNTSKLVLKGGTFDTGGFGDTIGVLSLGGNATIEFGNSGAVPLLFADSHLDLWTAGTQLNILNFTPGVDTLRFGSDNSALTPGQLAQIRFNGLAATITSFGFVQPVPEPGVSAAILSGLGVFGFYRRPRSRRATA